MHLTRSTALLLAGGFLALIAVGYTAANAPDDPAAQRTPTQAASTQAAQLPVAPARSTPAPAVPTSEPAAADVVRRYYAAVNTRDYPTAWALGGRRLSTSYATFVAGYRNTERVAVDVTHAGEDDVSVELVAHRSDGTTAVFAGTYTVSGGVISGAHIRPVR